MIIIEKLLNILTEMKMVFIKYQQEKDKTNLEMIVYMLMIIGLIGNYCSEYNQLKKKNTN